MKEEKLVDRRTAIKISLLSAGAIVLAVIFPFISES